MTDDSETILRVARDEALARDWELVLLAQGLSPRIRRTLDGIVLAVPSHEADKALAGLAAYEKETPAKAQRREAAPRATDLLAATLVRLLLLGFFIVTVVWNSKLAWLELGSANAGRIIDGELWRSVTALSLHGDSAHAVSNAFALAVFFGAASGQLGVGVAGALVLLAGAGGNLANAFIQGSPHDSVGASTAVFGAVGILGSLAMVRRSRESGNKRRAWIAIAAALALLGMLGSGSGRVDVLAHLLGFLIGGGLGFLIALVSPRPPVLVVQWICGGATLGVIVGSWLRALV
jgi:rhomboid protease GluP